MGVDIGLGVGVYLPDSLLGSEAQVKHKQNFAYSPGAGVR